MSFASFNSNSYIPFPFSWKSINVFALLILDILLKRMIYYNHHICKVNMISAGHVTIICLFSDMKSRQHFTVTAQVENASSAALAALRSTKSTRTNLFSP